MIHFVGNSRFVTFLLKPLVFLYSVHGAMCGVGETSNKMGGFSMHLSSQKDKTFSVT